MDLGRIDNVRMRLEAAPRGVIGDAKVKKSQKQQKKKALK